MEVERSESGTGSGGKLSPWQCIFKDWKLRETVVSALHKSGGSG